MTTAKTRSADSARNAKAPQPSAETLDLTAAGQAEVLTRLRLQSARIPDRFSGKGFDNFKTERNAKRSKVLQAGQAYVQSFNFKTRPPQGLFIRGCVGCGKTHIAVAILREIILKGYTGLYYNMPDLLMDIRATFDEGSHQSEPDFLEDLNSPHLLVLDDLGAEKTTPFVNDRLYLIVNRRYESCRPILVTTNLDLAELSDKLGERTVSRLCEICDEFVPFPDEDYRKKHMR